MKQELPTPEEREEALKQCKELIERNKELLVNEELKQQARKEFDERFRTSKTYQTIKERNIKSFIDSLINHTVQMERERIVGIIGKLVTVDITDQSGKMVREQLISKDSLLSLITNKSDINQDKED